MQEQTPEPNPAAVQLLVKLQVINFWHKDREIFSHCEEPVILDMQLLRPSHSPCLQMHLQE